VNNIAPDAHVVNVLTADFSEGLIRTGLDGAVPPIWRSKHATVPQYISAEQLENLLALCPSEGPGAVRNRTFLSAL
jgi:hypothetical protein